MSESAIITTAEQAKLDALRILLAGQTAPQIDRAEIESIVQAAIATHGTMRIEVAQPNTPTVTIEQAHKLLPVIIRWAAAGRHLYLYGPAGSGKSTLASQAATALSRRYAYIALCPQTPESKLLGYLDAHGNYRSTEFRNCYEHGGVFCIDEADNGSPALLTMLNGMLENGLGAFPDALVPRHADFVVIATGNTCGNGATLGYQRQAFDVAFAKRFSYLEISYDEQLERRIALSINPNASPSLVDWIVTLRQWARDTKARLIISPRETYRLATDLRDHADNIPIATLLNAAIWNGDEAQATKALLACPLPTSLTSLKGGN